MSTLIDPTAFSANNVDPSFQATIVRLINAINTAYTAAPQASTANVLTAIDGFSAGNCTTVRTKLDVPTTTVAQGYVNAASVAAAIGALDETQLAAVKTKLGIS